MAIVINVPTYLHVCIAVGAPFTAIHLEKLLQGEIQPTGQRLNAGAQTALVGGKKTSKF